MAKEKLVVVGAGGIAGAWFPPISQEDIRVTAVVDLRVEQAQNRINEYKLDALACTSVREAIRKTKPDFVLDLTIPEAHSKVTCTALAMGCHVIGEKPMASSMREARKMVKAAEKAGKMYMVSQSRRWNKVHDQAKATLAAGAIGELASINCDFYLAAHFGGFRDAMTSPLILDMSIHHFDLARCLAGVDPVAVYAKEFNPRGSWYKGDVAASCIFEMSNGVIFTYRGSWCAEGCHTSWNGDWRITGARGTMLMEKDQPARGQVVAGEEGFQRPLKDLTLSASSLEYENMHGALREMLAFLRTGKKPQTECHDNIKSLAMVFAAIESSRKGKRVMVKM